MFRYLVIQLALAALLSASPVHDRRSARSVWPFGSTSDSEATETPLLSEENALFLEQAGLGKNFNLSSHPLWRIHKYQGIDLKPVRLETEILSTPLAKKRADDAAAKQAEEPEEEVVVTTTEPVDLTFLDDLGGLAYFLPEPEANNNEEATDLIVKAIVEEEEKQPGFFGRLWDRIWSRPSKFIMSMFARAEEEGEEEKEAAATELEKKEKESDDSLAVYLPETQGSYVAVVVPPSEKTSAAESLPSDRDVEALVPLNHASQFREAVPAVQVPGPVAAYPNFSHSQAWVQSWTPHASYEVHIQNEPLNDNNINTNDLEPSSTNDSPFQRKIGHEEEEVVEGSGDHQPVTERKISEEEEEEEKIVVESSNEQPVTERKISEEKEEKAMEKPAEQQQTNEDNVERAKKILSSFQLPEGLLKKLQVKQQDVDEILNDKESAARAAARLRALQREFEMRKEQLSYSYSRVRKQNQQPTTVVDK